MTPDALDPEWCRNEAARIRATGEHYLNGRLLQTSAARPQVSLRMRLLSILADEQFHLTIELEQRDRGFGKRVMQLRERGYDIRTEFNGGWGYRLVAEPDWARQTRLIMKRG